MPVPGASPSVAPPEIEEAERAEMVVDRHHDHVAARDQMFSIVGADQRAGDEGDAIEISHYHRAPGVVERGVQMFRRDSFRLRTGVPPKIPSAVPWICGAMAPKAKPSRAPAHARVLPGSASAGADGRLRKRKP